MDALAQRAPSIDRPVEVELLGALHRTIDRHPRHDLGMGKMLRLAAHLPNSLIGLLPDCLEMRGERLLKCPGLGALRNAAEPRLMQRVHDLAVDVELHLSVRGVADAHWIRRLIAGQPRNVPFAQQPFAGQPVHDL